MTNEDLLSERFLEAFEMAFHLHNQQLRKESKIPYIAHLMAVSSLVLENGGNENQAIAGLLHDAVEDQGGWDTLKDIKDKFGEEVAALVDGCTDAYTNPKPPWKERKAAYLEKMKTAPESVILVSLADKVHNARSILLDLQDSGDQIWEKFNGGKAGTLWYYQSLANIFDAAPYPLLKHQLRDLVEEIITLANLQENSS
ncbi:MAG: HD domain-containing protein [Anaerolineales bacterium]|jgi:(p)ppGpp synthase/HD superfamily hydrolase